MTEFRSQQQFKNRTLIAAFAGERDARQKLRARVDDIGVRCGEIGFSLANIGALSEQFGRQPRGDTRVSDVAQASAPDPDPLRGPPHQNCKGHAIEAQCLLKRRNSRALSIDQAFLLSGVESGGGSRLQPLLDQVEHACGARKIFACNAQPVLRREDLEIGVGGSDHVVRPTTSRS